MKKITLLLLCLTTSLWSYSQCTSFTGGNYGGVTMANDGTAEQIAADNWPNAEYSVIENLVIGNTYTVTGTNTTSIYITVTETTPPPGISIGAVITHGASTVSFVATTPDILIFWHLDAACTTQASDDTLTTIQCTSASCSCTAGAAPDAAVATYPADGAVDIPIDNSGATPAILGFAWTDNGEATSYDINYPGIGTLSGASNPQDVQSTSFTYNTTFTWTVTSTNCLGTVTSATYTFTTEMDPSLSTEEFESNNSISHFYNVNTNDLTFKSSSLPFTNVEIYSILGQQVLNNKLSETNETISLSNLTDGIYIAKVSVDGRTEAIKFVKK